MGLPPSSQIVIHLRGEDKGEERIGFFNKEFTSTRRRVLREWIFTTCFLSIGILGILSIFWGAFMHASEDLKKLKIFVVSFDNDDFIGDQVLAYTRSLLASGDQQVGWELVMPEAFHNDPLEVRQAVYDFDAWAAIVVQPNATSTLRQAIANADTSYDPSGAAEMVYVGARDTYAMPTYVKPALSKFALGAANAVGQAWTRTILQNSTIQLNTISQVPQAFNPAIGFTDIDLRPLGPPQVLPAVTVGALYLIVVSFFSYAFFLPTHTHFVSEIEGHRKLFFYQLVMWKYSSAVFAYLFLSLSFSLVSLAFQIPFDNPSSSPIAAAMNPNPYGHATFFVYWMINWVGMIALGLASENVAMIVGQPWAALWLVFWIISNVCTALYPIDVEPRFYYYGYAFPLHNIVEASKQLLFDLHSRIGLNFGILFAWWAVNTAIFPLCAWVFRYKHFRALEKSRKTS